MIIFLIFMILCKKEIKDSVHKDELTVDKITSTSTTNREATIDNSEEVHAVEINSSSSTETATVEISNLSSNITGIFVIIR